MSLRNLVVPVALVALMVVVSGSSAQEHTKDTTEQIKKALGDKKAVLLDVREENEWKEGHLAEALFLPLSKLKAGVKADELTKTAPKDKIIYCHCGAGRRALAAAEILKKEGYDVRPLKFGYADLIKEGFKKAE